MKCSVMKEVAGKDECPSEDWSGALKPNLQTQQLGSILEKPLQEGSNQNFWLLKGPVVEDRRDAQILDHNGLKKECGSSKLENWCTCVLKRMMKQQPRRSTTSDTSSTSWFPSNLAAVKWISSTCKLEGILFSSDGSRFFATLMQAVGSKNGLRSSCTSLHTRGKV